MLTLLAVTMLLAQSIPPGFGDFPAPEGFKGKPAAVVLKSKRQRRFQTVIREGAARGPNFAGHYTVIEWGCGAGCVQFAIADAKTGQVYDPPFDVLLLPLGYQFDDDAGLEYKLDSRLLRARGCPGENLKACASYDYDWTGASLKLLRTTPARHQP